MANPLPHIFQQLSVQGPMSDLDDNFNALIGNVQSGAYMLAQDIGSANAYAATITPAPVAYQAGMIIVLQNIIAANTGASTFNLNGLGALPILKSANNALTGGEVIPGSLAVLVLNGTSAWHLIYASANFNPGPNSVFSSGSQFYGASTFDTMPQVGGAPIVESGSNANGSYTKWADGTMIVLGSIIILFSNSTQSNDYYWSFPAPFRDGNSWVLSLCFSYAFGSLAPQNLNALYTYTPQSSTWSRISASSTAVISGNIPVMLRADGYWK